MIPDPIKASWPKRCRCGWKLPSRIEIALLVRGDKPIDKPIEAQVKVLVELTCPRCGLKLHERDRDD